MAEKYSFQLIDTGQPWLENIINFTSSSGCKQIYIMLTVISLFALPTERKLLFTYQNNDKKKGGNDQFYFTYMDIHAYIYIYV